MAVANSREFLQKVIEVSERLGIDSSWLLDVMKFESGLDPKALNPNTGATGLIQFMPATARDLGTTVGELHNMDAIEQMEYVYKYLQPYSGKMQSLTDTYFAVFFPSAIGKPRSWVLQSSSQSAALIARHNPIFDTNHDNKITVGEVEDYLYNWLGYKKKA